jgi:hypothetical protein
MKIKQSKTQIIKRSRIKLNPLNPKNHTGEAIKLQKKNFQDIGFLGGIVWNKTTGNLIDGHRRVYAMDLIYKYDGTLKTDYDVKVEVVELDDKEEKTQLTYMAVGNTKADYNLIADYIHDIDYKDVGLSEEDYNSIISIADSNIENLADIDMSTYDDMIDEPIHKESERETREDIRAKKAKQREIAYERQQNEDAYIVLSFSTYEAKVAFCEMLGYNPEEAKYLKGEDVFSKINEL